MLAAAIVYSGQLDLSALTLIGLFASLIPVTIGNIIGGRGFGALIWGCHRTK